MSDYKAKREAAYMKAVRSSDVEEALSGALDCISLDEARVAELEAIIRDGIDDCWAHLERDRLINVGLDDVVENREGGRR